MGSIVLVGRGVEVSAVGEVPVLCEGRVPGVLADRWRLLVLLLLRAGLPFLFRRANLM